MLIRFLRQVGVSLVKCLAISLYYLRHFFVSTEFCLKQLSDARDTFMRFYYERAHNNYFSIKRLKRVKGATDGRLLLIPPDIM